jgi:hypothetical protein
LKSTVGTTGLKVVKFANGGNEEVGTGGASSRLTNLLLGFSGSLLIPELVVEENKSRGRSKPKNGSGMRFIVMLDNG